MNYLALLMGGIVFTGVVNSVGWVFTQKPILLLLLLLLFLVKPERQIGRLFRSFDRSDRRHGL